MTAALERVMRRSAPAELSPVGWIAGEELGYDDWLRQGARLGLAGRSAGWWIGDWVRYGTARYGSKYAAAARVTGYDRQTLMNMVYVTTRFEFSRRRENLSWSHHADLAALALEEQERWLNYALAERLSVRDLRDALAAVKQPRSRHGAGLNGKAPATALEHAGRQSRSHDRKRLSAGGASGQFAVCPHCGHKFIS